MDPIEDEDRDPIERRDQHAFEYTMHEGQGPLSVEHHFAAGSELTVAVQTWTLGVGAFEGMHAHDDPPLEEIYLVTEGACRACARTARRTSSTPGTASAVRRGPRTTSRISVRCHCGSW